VKNQNHLEKMTSETFSIDQDIAQNKTMITIHHKDLNASRVRLVKSLTLTLVEVISAQDEGKFFEQSAESVHKVGLVEGGHTQALMNG